MKANEIKIIFIKWLLKKYPSSIIGNEVLFSNHQYRTDILQILSNKTHAYEIKSDSDNLDYIDEQLKNYIETFDYTYLVFTEKYSLDKLKSLNQCVGLYLINKFGDIKLIRKAKLSKYIIKKNLLYFLHKKELIDLLNQKGLSTKSVFELRSLCEKIAFEKVKQKSIETLSCRYCKLLNLFLHDTEGKNITIDDLTSLTGNLYIDELR